MWVHRQMIPLCSLQVETASHFCQRNGRFRLVLLLRRWHTCNKHIYDTDRMATMYLPSGLPTIHTAEQGWIKT